MENGNNCAKVNYTKILITIDRLSAWVLLVVAILYGITGYAMTKGLIDSSLASDLHLGWLGAIGLIAFVIHTSWAIHLFFRRHCIWNLFTKTILVLFYVILVSFFLFMQFVYSNVMVTDQYQPIPVQNIDTTTVGTVSPVVTNVPDAAVVNNNTNTNANTNVSPVSTPVKPVFTATTLTQYNGQNGKPAYVAVDGLVYDLSTVFRGGNHKGWSAGLDLSAAFHDQHPANYLSRYSVVGSYQGN